MAASFQWAQNNGVGAVVTILGSSGNLADFKNIDTTGIGDYAANPIQAGNNSFEVWLRAWFSGTFNRIDGLRFWQSTNYSPATGLQVFWKGTQTIYLQPAAGTSSIATSSVATSDPGSTNVGIGGNLSGSLVASGYSDFIVLQLRTTASAPAGDTSLATYTLSYNEN
jgi:hypothetical protein